MSKIPNIVYVLFDDMGYGDVSCLNPEGKIPTPNFDRCANQGMTFTNAHSTSSVCSPSRYGILTGRYNWRSKLQQYIVDFYGDPLIDKDRLTVPKLLKQNGYHTACIGKWHLGMGWDFDTTDDFLPQGGIAPGFANGFTEATERQKTVWKNAFSKPITGGPIAAGFDYYFGVDVPNWPPYCFIENDRTVGIPSEWLQPRLLGDNLAGQQGPAMPYWNFEQLLPTFASKADSYIKERTQNNETFFLYLPMTSPHTPLSVNKKWIGKSGLNNLYADLVMESDDIFGQILDSLDRYGVADNTLVILTSDNGCAHYIGADQLEAQGHYPSGKFRGYKSDAWDGGHHIPFFARWPGVIREGSKCDELLSQADLMATCASIIDETLSGNAGEDSVSMMSLFKETGSSTHDYLVHHSILGKFAICDKQWKLVLCPGSGGWSKDDAQAYQEGLPLVQLYDLMSDPGEKRNLCNDHPDIVKSMIRQLEKFVDAGRSTDGGMQPNDTSVDIWKLYLIPGAGQTILDDY